MEEVAGRGNGQGRLGCRSSEEGAACAAPPSTLTLGWGRVEAAAAALSPAALYSKPRRGAFPSYIKWGKTCLEFK